MIALAEQCMADYDENGWTGDTWLEPGRRWLWRDPQGARRGVRGNVGWASLTESEGRGA